MQFKVSLRKLNAMSTEIQGIIRKYRHENDDKTVTLHSTQTTLFQDTIKEYTDRRTELFNKSIVLQALQSNFRRIVAAKNLEFGVTETLQTIRENEDVLAIYTSYLVEKSKRPEYDGHSILEDAFALLELSKQESSAAARLGRSNSSVTVRVPSEEGVVNKIKDLQRTIKKLKNETLTGLNFIEFSVELTEDQKELLESLNVI